MPDVLIRIGRHFYRTFPMGTIRFRHPDTGEWVQVTHVPSVFRWMPRHRPR